MKLAPVLTKQTDDGAIIILRRFCFTNLQNFFKKPVGIKTKLINRRTENVFEPN